MIILFSNIFSFYINLRLYYTKPLTLLINSWKSRFTIDLTICPFTSASQILRYVLTTSNPESTIR